MLSLANDRSIVKKNAGKCSSVVVWDREDCVAAIGKQLNDESVYYIKQKILQDLAE